MFEATLDLGSIDERSVVEPPRIYDHKKYVPIIKAALKEQGLNPSTVLLRGGFETAYDLELLLKHGSDYHGRLKWNQSRLYNRSRPGTTFLSTIQNIGEYPVDYRSDPLWCAMQPWNDVHVMAVFDASQLTLVDDKFVAEMLREYRFLHPRKKLEALLGLLHIDFTVVPHPDFAVEPPSGWDK